MDMPTSKNSLEVVKILGVRVQKKSGVRKVSREMSEEINMNLNIT